MNDDGQSRTAPQDLELELCALVAAELKLAPDQLTATTPVRDLGIDSIHVLRLIAKIERKYDVELEDEVVFRVINVKDLANAVARERSRGS